MSLLDELYEALKQKCQGKLSLGVMCFAGQCTSTHSTCNSENYETLASNCYPDYLSRLCSSVSNTFCHNLPQGDESYKGSCYNFPAESYSWHDAKITCEGNGAHLIAINDRYEGAFISAFLGELGTRVWIGLNGTVNGDGSVTFNWVTGEPVDFTNWDEFEPNPEHGTCVAASGDSATPGLWTVWNCADVFRFICEYDREGWNPNTPTPTEPPGVNCAVGWNHKGDRCYRVFHDPLPWGQAELFCGSYGGHLTSINSADEENTIQSLPGVAQINATFMSVWTGLELGSDSVVTTLQALAGYGIVLIFSGFLYKPTIMKSHLSNLILVLAGYHWTDGSAVDYINWADGQPSSQYERDTCGSANKNSFKLSLSNCNGYLPFICEAREGTMHTTMAPPTPPQVEVCDDFPSWYRFGDHCYKFISESEAEPQTWWTAHRKCRDEGGELASIHTVEENYWIESMLVSKSDKTFWIGGRSFKDSGYEWIDGSPFDFDNWYTGEPNDMLDQEDCIGIYAHRTGYWNDQNCAHLEGRICKRPYGETHAPPDTTPNPGGHCLEGWAHAGVKCLKFFGNQTSFDTARAACKALHENSDLISIHSAVEQAHMLAGLAIYNVDVWTGLRFDGEYVWVDQSKVTYTNWAPGEPNGGTSGELCAEAYRDTGMWNDVGCDYSKGYVCQMPQDPSITEHNPPKCSAPYDSYLSLYGACYKLIAEGKTWLNNNVYKWTDGWPVFYTNWGKDQPTVNDTDYDCVMLRDMEGTWFNVECSRQAYYACKYKNGTVPTPDPPTTGHCADERWLDLGGGYCYLIVQEHKIWSDASTNCIQQKGNLVSIHSQSESDLIQKAIKYVDYPLWTGLIQMTEGFGWSDNTAMDFINWEDGEPNNDWEQCGEIYPDRGTWNDIDCASTRPSICKALKGELLVLMT
ncbi:hypothetical protein SK128_003942 [Halocaridina rubra]|uniref:C-type lectin domain-containing protein n=1 Tax=Halocaridina rubra TaxID=373956 RepID=A0AAN9A3G8_HALRR